MSARRSSAASPSISSAWWRSIPVARARAGSPRARSARTPPGPFVVDAQLRGALGGCAPPACVHWPSRNLRRVPRVGVHQDELADVVQQTETSSSSRSSYLASFASRSAARSSRPRAGGSALAQHPSRGGRRRSRRCWRARQSASTPAGVSTSTALGTLRSSYCLRRVGPVRDAQHRDHGDVGLDGGDHVACGGVLLPDEPERAVARLGESRTLERLERGGEATSMPLVLPSAGGGGMRRGPWDRASVLGSKVFLGWVRFRLRPCVP